MKKKKPKILSNNIKKEALPDSAPELIQEKKGFIVGALVLALSIGSFWLIAKYISDNVWLDTIDLLNQAARIAIVGALRPEPTERLLFICGLLLFPIFLVGFTLLIRHVFVKITDTIVNKIYLPTVIVATATLSYFIYRVLFEVIGPNETNLSVYFSHSIFYVHPVLYALVLFPLVLFMLLKLKASEEERSGPYFKAFSATLIVLQLALIVLASLTSVITVNNVDNTLEYLYHFDSVFYPVSQVHGGKALLVDMNSLYGLYPHFIEPIFRIIGLSVFKFSLVMAGLMLLSFLSLFLAINKLVKNNLLRFLGFTTIMFVVYLSNVYLAQPPYYQYFPVRLLFPCLLIYLTALYYDNKSRAFYYLLLVASAVAVLWNLDSGIAVLLACTLTLCYSECFNYRSAGFIATAKNCLGHLGSMLGAVLLVGGVYSMAILVNHGQLPDFSRLFVYTEFYYKYGYYMLPMPLAHPWMIVIFIYLIGLLYSFICLLQNTDEHRAKMIACLSLLGTGIFSYYQGRSVNQALTPVWYPAIILLTIYADVVLAKVRTQAKMLPHNIMIIIMITCVISFSIFSFYGIREEAFNYYKTKYADGFKRKSVVGGNIYFIEKYARPGEGILILSGNEAAYYAESGTHSSLNKISFRDYYFRRELEALIEYLDTNRDSKIYYDNYFSETPEYYPLRPVMKILAEKYRVVDQSADKAIMLLMRKDL